MLGTGVAGVFFCGPKHAPELVVQELVKDVKGDRALWIHESNSRCTPFGCFR